MMASETKLHLFANDRLRISATSYCNFSCVYCTNEGQSHRAISSISLDFIKQLSNFIKSNNIYIRKINITGGEPLLHPQLFKIISLLVGCAESITLNTNGELLDFNKIVALRDSGITCIKFGIDSFFQKTSKPFIKNTVCNPTKIIDNLLFAKSIMEKSSVNMVLTNFNDIELENNLFFCTSNRINFVELLELIKFDFRKQFARSYSGIQLSEVIHETNHLFKRINYNIKLGKYLCETHTGLTIQLADDFCKSRVCKNLWTRIDSSGNLIPCIKSSAKIKIDFNNLINQIQVNNKLMCDAVIDKHIPRNISGELLHGNTEGYYYPNYLDIIKNNKIGFSEMDP